MTFTRAYIHYFIIVLGVVIFSLFTSVTIRYTGGEGGDLSDLRFARWLLVLLPALMAWIKSGEPE